MKPKYYIGDHSDPENKKQVNRWSYLEAAGFLEAAAKAGAIINPIHDFEKLKQVRLEYFEAIKVNFIEDNEFEQVAIDAADIVALKRRFLNNELLTIEKWRAGEKNAIAKIAKKKKGEGEHVLGQLDKYECFINTEIVKLKEPQPKEPQPKHPKPPNYEDLFYNKADAIQCLGILQKLDDPMLNADFEFIKGSTPKGAIPLWVKLLQENKPSIIKGSYDNADIANALNEKIKGLELTKDASEFRKVYNLKKGDIERNIKQLISQTSLLGKTGK